MSVYHEDSATKPERADRPADHATLDGRRDAGRRSSTSSTALDDGRDRVPARPSRRGRPSPSSRPSCCRRPGATSRCDLEELAAAVTDAATGPLSRRRRTRRLRTGGHSPCVLPHFVVPTGSRAPAPSSATPAMRRSSISSRRPAAACRRRPPRAPRRRVRRRSTRPAPRPTRAAASRSASVELLAPIRRPGKLLAVAGNFQAHIEEGGGQRVDKTKIVPEAVHQAVVVDHRAGRGGHAADGLERARLGARARHRHRHARPRHPARQGPRPHRRLLGHQRHLGALDAVGRRGPRRRAASTTSSTGSTASGATASRRGARGSPRPTR